MGTQQISLVHSLGSCSCNYKYCTSHDIAIAIAIAIVLLVVVGGGDVVPWLLLLWHSPD